MVFALQCDLFSLAKIEGPDSLKKLLKKPNFFQTTKQFLWDYMFWLMLGTSYLESESRRVDKDGNNLYWLDSSKLEFPKELQDLKDSQIFTQTTKSKIDKSFLKYRNHKGKARLVSMKNVKIFSDLTNGIGNWFQGPSRIDALYKIIMNADESLDSKNVNLKFTKKFIVTGQTTEENVNQLQMAPQEKQSLETRIDNPNKKVYPMISQVDIKRFTDNIKQLNLDESFMWCYYQIGKMYGIPKDVLEAFLSKGATHENQEKARASHVSYSLQSKGDDFIEGFMEHFGLPYDADTCKLTWLHLPFNQIAEKDRAESKKSKVDTLKILFDMGGEPKESAEYVEDTRELSEITFKPKEDGNTGPGQGNGQEGEEGDDA